MLLKETKDFRGEKDQVKLDTEINRKDGLEPMAVTIPSIRSSKVEIEEGRMKHEMEDWDKYSQEYCLKQKESCEDILNNRSNQEVRIRNQKFLSVDIRENKHRKENIWIVE